jgi:hypothetical protein
MPKYRITGTHSFLGHEPGAVVELELEQAHEERAINTGRIERVRSDAKTVDEKTGKE